MKTIICKTCKQEKLIEQFAKHKQMASGYQNECKACVVIRVAEWRKNNPGCRHRESAKRYSQNMQVIQERLKQWAIDHPEQSRLRYKKYRLKHPEYYLAKAAQREASKLQATPAWAIDEFEQFFMMEAYALASMRTKMTGTAWNVDHIVPLRSKLVCGLHCAANLAVIPARLNLIKSNRYWPDMP